MLATFVKDLSLIYKVLLLPVLVTRIKETTRMINDGGTDKVLKWFTFQMEACGIMHIRNFSKKVWETKSCSNASGTTEESQGQESKS